MAPVGLEPTTSLQPNRCSVRSAPGGRSFTPGPSGGNSREPSRAILSREYKYGERSTGGAEHGRKSPEVIQGYTICSFCPSAASLPTETKRRLIRVRFTGIAFRLGPRARPSCPWSRPPAVRRILFAFRQSCGASIYEIARVMRIIECRAHYAVG